MYFWSLVPTRESSLSFSIYLLLIFFWCLPCVSMDLFIEIYPEINSFIATRAGDTSECAEWFQMSDPESTYSLQKAILPLLSGFQYLKQC